MLQIVDVNKKSRMEMGKQVEKIREEIERRKKEYCNGLDSVTELYDSLLSFIDSIQEEPVSKDLEEAASQYSFNIPSAIFNGLTPVLQNIWKREIEGAFVAGAKLQEKQIMKDAIEREVKVDAGGYPYIDDTELYDYDNDKPLAKAGDKIKVVFIKE